MLSNQHSGQTQQQGVELLPDAPEKAHLKPERVQELLMKLPGWKLGAEGRGISRRRHFTSVADTQAFVRQVGKLASRHGQPVTIALSGKRVDLTLVGRPGKTRNAGLTFDVFNLASQLG